ncbi:M48 family metalloprotease [Conexibacter sp. CPCC 206217]|uniref:M48 family metalloprotease n=1 Tax=Conexibacter sp. CPCC 206217 TaxID=3064574 RepID=UPI00271B1E29|nr:M48 family metalloprotease [Conexibacter sp. CPCC 206217]MDO8209523.1 M48 family metalloprotease [Conexibacter sp. CPCC 206217]
MHDRPTALRLHALLVLLGVVATLAAVAAVLAAMLLGEDAAHAIDHHHEPLLVHLLLEWPLVTALALLVGVVSVRTLGVLLAHARARVRLRPLLAAAQPRIVGGIAVAVLDDARPAAFCAGLLHPRVYVTSGALAAFGTDGDAGDAGVGGARCEGGGRGCPEPLHALLAHEAAHARRRDPLRRLGGEVVARGLFFLPVLRPLSARQAAVAELRADAAAVAACDGDVRPLANALLTFEQAQRSPLRIDPERVDSLAGVQRPWRQPSRALAVALGTLALVLACPVLAVEHMTGRALHLFPFGVEVCLASVLALPCALAALLVFALMARTPRRMAPVPSI